MFVKRNCQLWTNWNGNCIGHRWRKHHKNITDILCCFFIAYDKNSFKLNKERCILPYLSQLAELIRELKTWSEKKQCLHRKMIQVYNQHDQEEIPGNLKKKHSNRTNHMMWTYWWTGKSFNIINPVLTEKNVAED